MNKCAKFFAAALAVLGISGTAAWAAALDKYEIDEDNELLTLMGTIEGMKKYDDITIQLLKKGKNFDNSEYSGGKISEDFLLFTQIPANENGGYEVTVNMKGESAGFYEMRVNGAGTEKKVFYSKTSDKEDIAGQICAIAKKEKETAVAELEILLDLKNEFSTAVGVLNLSEQTIFTAEAGGMCEVIYTMIGGRDLSAAEIVDTINKASYIQLIREGKDDVNSYKIELELDAAYTAAYDKLDDSAKTGFSAKYFKGKNNLTPKQIAESYKAAVLDTIVGSFKTWKNVEEFITDFGSIVGVDMTAFNAPSFDGGRKSNLYTAVLKHGAFESVAECKEFINAEIAKPVVPLGGGSGGSGGGGGGGGIVSGGTSAPITTPVTTPAGSDVKSEFDDMEGYEWAKDCVRFLSEKSIVTGVGENKFEPGRSVTREEFAAMLLRAYDITPDVTHGIVFSDVDAGEWYAGYISSAVKLGIINGISDSEFGTGSEISREDAAVMASRIMGGENTGSDAGSFSDESEISDYAKTAVKLMKDKGILSGAGDGRFYPKNVLTRAEAAKLIYELIK